MAPKLLSAWFGMLLAFPQLAGAAAPTYAVTPVSGKYTRAVDLNNAGQIAVNNFAPDVPFQIGSIVGPATSESVGTLGGSESIIRGINNKGEAVGISRTASGEVHAFLYAGGRIQDLTVAYGLDTAADINDRGDIAGEANGRGALLGPGGSVDYFGPSSTHAAAINDPGEVAGDHIVPGGGTHAFMYSQGSLTDLGTPGGTFSTGNAINDAGTVVGAGFTSGGQSHAFLYQDGVMTDLGQSAISSTANDINNLAQIVGAMDARAFLYENGKLTDLNTLIGDDADFLLVSATAINDKQQILARACDPSGTFCDSTVRLDPIPQIPEPGSTGMLAAGAILLGLHSLARRRRLVPARPALVFP